MSPPWWMLGLGTNHTVIEHRNSSLEPEMLASAKSSVADVPFSKQVCVHQLLLLTYGVNVLYGLTSSQSH